MDKLILEFLARLQAERGCDAVVMTLGSSEDHFTSFVVRSTLSIAKQDEVLLKSAARLSPTFAQHLGEALLAYRRNPPLRTVEGHLRRPTLPDEGGDKTGGE